MSAEGPPAAKVRLLDTRTGSVYEINLTDVQKCRVKAEPEYAEDLIAKAIRKGAQPLWSKAQGNGDAVVHHNFDGQKVNVWTTKTATRRDEAATLQLIKIMSQPDIQTNYKGKKRLRNTFEEVCSHMHAADFIVGRNIREGGIRCQQKWRSLKSMCVKYSTHLKTCDPDDRATPPKFYELVRHVEML